MLSIFYLLMGDVYQLINYMSFVQWFAIGVSVAALLYFRYSLPDTERPLKVSDTARSLSATSNHMAKK